jgi:hypothetical protein
MVNQNNQTTQTTMRIYNYKYIYILYTPIYIKSPKPHHVKTLLTAGDESEVAHCFPLPAVMDMFAISD